ncbi:MAG: PIN domain-containing protein [Armatimonadetes bacterium]|nr:PIN domain-containing protein [Armatimonadota bacterium]
MPVVLDTNVVVGFFLSRHPRSGNQRVFRLWYHRQLQIIISEEAQIQV